MMILGMLGVFYGLTGEGYSYRELENQAKLIKNELLRVKDVAKSRDLRRTVSND